MRNGIAGASVGDGADHLGHRHRKHTAPMLTLTAITLLASLVTLSPAEAAEEPTGESASSPSQTSADVSPDDSVDAVEVVRYVGSDQYELSIEVAQALMDAGGGASEWVVLASGESWTEAAAAGPLAASLGGPVVLVPPAGLQTATARPDLVEFLRSSGVRRVVIVGDPDVLPNHEPSVLYGLGMLPRNIERVYGDDPAGTSTAIAERFGAPASLGELGRTVIIASDQSVADAVAVGPLAAAGPFPLMLTAPDAFDPRIATYLTGQQIEHVVLVGGTNAITPAVQKAIEAAGVAVTRLAGRDRNDTARLAADLFEQHADDDPACTDGPTRIGLVPAQRPEHALTAGPLLAVRCSPLRYTEPGRLPADLRNNLYLNRDLQPGILVTVFGTDAQAADGAINDDKPPARLATFNFRLSADGRSLDGVLEIIDDSGNRRAFPQARLTRHLQEELPSDWRNRPQRNYHLVIDYWTGVRWSHDGEWLAYRGIDGESLFVLDIDSGKLRRIGPIGHRIVADAIGSRFHWSPVANKLVFSAVVEDKSTLSDPDLTPGGVSEFTSELFVYDAESDATVQLTNNNFRDDAGPWSPDGSHLAFVQTPALPAVTSRFGHVAYRRLKVLELTTGDSTTVHDYALSAAGGRYAGGGFESIVLWSPDGTKLAYSAVPGGDRLLAAPHLYVATLGESEPAVFENPDCEDCESGPTYFPLPYIHVAGWSPLGDNIAYSAQFLSDTLLLALRLEDGDSNEVARHSTSRSGWPRLETSAEYIGWTADGQKLRYLSSECRYFDGYSTTEMEVVEVPLDGSRRSSVLEVPSRIGDRYASCAQVNLLAPNGRGIALHDGQLGMRAARFGDGVWRELLTPAQRPPESSFDTYNCHMAWANDGIRIGCAHSTGDY